MTTTPDQPADTRAMRIVHDALRRDLGRARTVLTEAPYPDDHQRVAVAEHLLWLMTWLHEHHESEDEGLYPVVRRQNPAAAELLDRMDEDHQAILPALAEVEGAAYVYRGSAAVRPWLVAAIDRLTEVAYPHLEREERQLMPVVSASITQRQWDDWNQEYHVRPHGFVDLADMANWVLDGLAPEDRALMESVLPAIPRWLVVHLMVRRYRRAAFARWRLPEHSPHPVAPSPRSITSGHG